MGKMKSSATLLFITILLIVTEPTICSLANNINATFTCISIEMNALFRFKASLSIPSSDKLSSWIETNYDCCTWQGLECDKATGHVIGLHLGNRDGRVDNMLQGNSIDSSLLDLKYLRILDLSLNNFHGSHIPKFIGSMKQLQHLNLSNANFASIVPHQLGNLTLLRTLDLEEDNGNLIVDDLTWASNLSSLEYLDMSHVDLSRANNVVEVLGKLSSILLLRLSKSGLDKTNLAHRCVNSTLFTNIQSLDLSFNYFEEDFPCFIRNMTSLSFLDLSYNHYYNFSDPRSFASKNLTHINLEANSINHTEDWISDFLWDKCHLKSLNLNNNQFFGDISVAFENLSRCSGHNLESLDLGDNKFYGYFPKEIVNLRALRLLSLSRNNLSGKIPVSLGQLSNLEEINLYSNSFEGTLLEAHFATLSRLEIIDASSNYMLKLRVGYEWAPLFRLKYLWMQSVEIAGPFPHWLQAQKNTLIKLNLSSCSITGTLPEWLSSLTNLNELDLSDNHIEGPVPNLSSTMIALDLSNNMINGSIPDSLCQMKGLDSLDLSKNHLSGNLPDCWGNFESLTSVALSSNKLTGDIPSSIGEDYSLEWLQLNNNSLTGEIPSTLMNCTSLFVLDVGDNNLYGQLPEWIGNLHYLAAIGLRNNEFYGPIPWAFCQLSLLQIIDLANNKLTKNIPSCFGDFLGMAKGGSFAASELLDTRLYEVVKGVMREYTKISKYLIIMDLSSNHLVGEIPAELTNLTGLISLNLSHNHLEGTIPGNIGDMKSLESLDLSSNNLFGTIPQSLPKLTFLGYINLSQNNLSGKIPTGPQLEIFNDLWYGSNPGLCGAPLLSHCPLYTENDAEDDGDTVTGKKKYVMIILGVLAAIMLMLSFGIPLFVIRKLQQRKREEELHNLLTLDGYTDDNVVSDSHYLRLFTYASIQSATNNFSSDYKLGEGGFGPVYKGKTHEGKDIAVKLLSEESVQGVLEFKTELILISKLQHVNLVKLIGFCVHGDEKMIIYDYMPNKSLDFFLFNPSGKEQLNWQKRFSIIEGIAQGLLYLHKYSRIKIIHRDLKPSNILLDQNMIPKISDFGLARIFKRDISEVNTSKRVGTYGYMAPEYAMQGIFTVKSDVYSFGVLILEIVSGRKNNSFNDIGGHLSLVEYAWELWRKGCFLELMDPTLIDSCVADHLKRCVHIGFLCVENRAVDRPIVEDVMSMIKNEKAKLPMPKSPTFITRNN